MEQIPDRLDQRQKLLRLTPAGEKLWGKLPDLTFIRAIAFQGLDAENLAIAIDVLRTATKRLDELTRKGTEP